jgi:hypothetical protein
MAYHVLTTISVTPYLTNTQHTNERERRPSTPPTNQTPTNQTPTQPPDSHITRRMSASTITVRSRNRDDQGSIGSFERYDSYDNRPREHDVRQQGGYGDEDGRSGYSRSNGGEYGYSRGGFGESGDGNMYGDHTSKWQIKTNYIYFFYR